MNIKIEFNQSSHISRTQWSQAPRSRTEWQKTFIHISVEKSVQQHNFEPRFKLAEDRFQMVSSQSCDRTACVKASAAAKFLSYNYAKQFIFLHIKGPETTFFIIFQRKRITKTLWILRRLNCNELEKESTYLFNSLSLWRSL